MITQPGDAGAIKASFKKHFQWSVGGRMVHKGGSISAPGARLASFFDYSPPVPVFAPPSANNLKNLLAVSKNLAHPLHPAYDDGKGGGWKWWFLLLLNSHISAYARYLARKVCGLVRSTWGTSLGEDKLRARDRILDTKVARWACTGHVPGVRRANIPPRDTCTCPKHKLPQLQYSNSQNRRRKGTKCAHLFC